MQGNELPKYRDLESIPGTGARRNWGLFGDGDEIGTVNFLTDSDVRKSSGLVKYGRVINLSLPLNLPDPPLGSRNPYSHEISVRRNGRDDVLSGFYPQGSTQWDGLQHVRYREYGYYGGRSEDELSAGALGIDRLAAHGLIGRGVLIDFAGYRASTGKPLDPCLRYRMTPADIEATLHYQSVALEEGDVLLLRTGWLTWYLSLTPPERAALRGRLHNRDETGINCPGLDPHPETAAYLWDNRVAAIAADNPTVEALQVKKEEGFLHRLLIPLLGMPLGEFWPLDELAEACRDSRRYEFMFVSVPFNLPNGVGSPGNGVAIL
jgi:kynurenine formamidase